MKSYRLKYIEKDVFRGVENLRELGLMLNENTCLDFFKDLTKLKKFVLYVNAGSFVRIDKIRDEFEEFFGSTLHFIPSKIKFQIVENI